MASFSDNLQQFTGYSPETNVQALVDVGQRKQNEFDAGVQRIQGEVSQIANLPIVKEQGKQYLQAKLGQLKSTLSTSVASDFSDSRLINQIGGLTKEIGTDPIIQGQVQDALNIQANDALQQKDFADGKANPANPYVYNRDKNNWLNDGDLKSRYTGGYSRQIDIDAKLREAAKAVGEDERIVEQMFKTDGQGNIIPGKDGRPQMSDYMSEQHFKGKDYKKVYDYFISSLSPEDYNQLAINGQYQYRNATPQDLIKDANNSYVAANKEYLDRQLTSQIKLTQLQNKTKKSPQDLLDIEALTKNVNDYSLALSDNEKKYNSVVDRINTNPEQVKGDIYTTDHLLAQAIGLSGTSEYTLFKDSPLFDSWVKKQNLNISLQNLSLRDKEFQASQYWKSEDSKFDRYKFRIEHPELANIEGRNGPLETPSDYISGKYDELQNYNDQSNNAAQKLAVAAIKSWNPQMDEATALKQLKAWSDKLGQSPEEVNQRFATRYLEELKGDKTKLDKTLQQTALEYGTAKTNAENTATVLQNSIEYAKSQSKLNNAPILDEEQIKKQIKPTTISLVGGGSVKLSTEDLLDWAKVKSKGGFDNNIQKASVRDAEKRLRTKFGNDYSKIEYVLATPTEEGVMYDPSLKPVLDMVQSAAYKNLRGYQEDFFKSKGTLPQTKEFDLNIGKGKEEDFKTKIVNTIRNYSGVSLSEGDAKDLMNAIQTGKGGSTNKVVVHPSFQNGKPNSYTLDVTVGGKQYNSVTLTEQDAQFLTGKPQFAPYQTNTYIDLLRYSNTGSTNSVDPSSPNAWKTSAFHEFNFPKVDMPEFTMNADFVNDRSGNGAWLKLYLIKDGKTIPVTMGKQDPNNPNREIPFDYDELPATLSQLTTDDIKKELK